MLKFCSFTHQAASITLDINPNGTELVDPNLVVPKQLQVITIGESSEEASIEDEEASVEVDRLVDIQLSEDSSSSEEDDSSSVEDSEEEMLKNLQFRNVQPVAFDIPTNFSGRHS
jgi:hypothetical protein